MNLSQGSLRQLDLLRCGGALRVQFNEIDSTFWGEKNYSELSEAYNIMLFFDNNEG